MIRFKKNKRAISILLIFTVACLGFWVYGKYYASTSRDNVLKAQDMYFRSNLLKKKDKQDTKIDHTITNWQSGDSINLTFMNFPDSERYTATDIEYTLSASDTNVTFKKDGSDIDATTPITISASSSKETHNSQEIKMYIADSFFDDNTEQTVKVVATVTKPYEYQLSAIFHIQQKATGYQVKVEDNSGSPYAKVTITTNQDINLLLEWDGSKLVPDKTNASLINQTITNNSVKLEVLDTSAIVFYMFKFDENAIYSETDIKVTEISKGG